MKGFSLTLEIASDHKSNVIDVRFKGVIELKGFNSAFQSIINQPDWEPGKSIIFDYRELDFRPFTSADMHKVSDLVVQYKTLFGSAKWALIISSDLQYGLMRVWEILTEDRVPMNINLFKSRKAARAWIMAAN
jgi:hypothetical protein